MRKAKGMVKRGFKDLQQLADKSKTRLDAAVTKARQNTYKGTDLANDLFDYWQDVFEVVANTIFGDDAVPTAFIRYRADNTAGVRQSSEMSFPEPLKPAQIALLQISDLIGPVVGGAQKMINFANVAIKIQPPGATESTDYIVEVNQAVPPADKGLYRGVLVDGGKLLAEIHVLTF